MKAYTIIRLITRCGLAFTSMALTTITNAAPPLLPASVSQYLNSGWFGEDHMLLDTGGNLTQFTNYITGNWLQILDNFDACFLGHKMKDIEGKLSTTI